MTETKNISRADTLLTIVRGLKSPKFKNERQAVRYMNEILDIHIEMVKAGKLGRKIRRRMKKVWKHELPYNVYELLGLPNAVSGRHVRMIVEAK